MATRKHHPLTHLPSFQRQNLLVEFASLKHSAPRGIYLSLTPNNPALWHGFASIRSGHYRGAILKFLLAFPSSYPSLPPDLMLQTRVFHPLVDPQTGRFALEAVIDGWSVKALPPTPSGEPGNVPLDITVVELLEGFISAFEGAEVLELVPERLVVDKEAWRVFHGRGWEDRVKRCVLGSENGIEDAWVGEEMVKLEEGVGRDEVWRICEEAKEGLERRGLKVREW